MDAQSLAKQELLARAAQLGSKVDSHKPAVILLTEGSDPRVQQAAKILSREHIARVEIVLPLDGPQFDASPGVTVIHPQQSPEFQSYADTLFEKRKNKGLDRGQAQALVTDPLYFGALRLGAGLADAAVSGSLSTTANVIRAGVQALGCASPDGVVSSIFLMLLSDGRKITYADCGVVPAPDVSQLARIACDSADTHLKLTGEAPRVAFLSFSTLGSAEHESVNKVRAALQLARNLRPDILFDGELQFDAAFVPAVAKRKAPGSLVAGNANVFIFPDLNSGNIAYKITERIGGATALGPILQGLKKPWMDLSRGCSADDIVLVSAIAIILSQGSK